MKAPKVKYINKENHLKNPMNIWWISRRGRKADIRYGYIDDLNLRCDYANGAYWKISDDDIYVNKCLEDDLL